MVVDSTMYDRLRAMRRGRRIRALRQLAGMSQGALGQALNRTRATVSLWEVRDAQPDLDTVHKLAEVLQVPVEILTAPTQEEVTE